MRDLAEVCPSIAPGTPHASQAVIALLLIQMQANHMTSLSQVADTESADCTGRILRSACPTAASEQDIDIIRHKLGISHLVSLDVLRHRNLPLWQPALNLGSVATCFSLFVFKVDLRSEFERSEDPASPLVENAELRVSKRQGSIAQASSVLPVMCENLSAVTKQYVSLCTLSGS